MKSHMSQGRRRGQGQEPPLSCGGQGWGASIDTLAFAVFPTPTPNHLGIQELGEGGGGPEGGDACAFSGL